MQNDTMTGIFTESSFTSFALSLTLMDLLLMMTNVKKNKNISHKNWSESEI